MVTSSLRASWDLSPNALEAACRRRRDAGLPVLDLAQSNPTNVGLLYPRETILQALASPQALGYTPRPLGLDSARSQVAHWYRSRGLDVSAAQVVLTASSSEAYAYLLKLLCDPGESILVPQPSYPLFDQLAKLEGVAVVRYPLLFEDGWRIDVTSLREAVRSDTRAIFVVSPNNPTGSFLHQDERAALEDVARQHDLALVCDEVFAEYVWMDHADRVRCAALGAKVLTFSLGGLSKSAGLPQMKLGWILIGGEANEVDDAMARIEMIADTYLSVAAPVQAAVGPLLSVASTIREQIATRIHTNLSFLVSAIDPPCPVTPGRVDAGWYVPLRVPSVMSDEAWAARLVERDGVLVHPGSFFGFERPGTLICGLIAPPDEFERGIARLVQSVCEACAS